MNLIRRNTSADIRRQTLAFVLTLSAFLEFWASGVIEAKGPALAIRRDWRAAPAIVNLGTPSVIFAVGDVHGDYKRLVHLLKKAELVHETSDSPADIRWNGGSATLICTGDIIDKGNRSLDVIACFQSLGRQAEAVGGQVVVTMGNHEAEFLADPTHDEKAETFVKELEEAGIEPADVAAGKDTIGAGKFIGSLPFAARAGEWFFLHAGCTNGMTIDTLSREIQDSVEEEGFGAAILLGKRGLLEARLKPIPWWERPGDAPEKSEARLRGYVDALAVKHLVVGHQPGKAEFSDGTKREPGQMLEKFGGLIFLIDVGMSSAIDKSKGALLKIEAVDRHEQATVIGHDGQTMVLWSKRR